MSDCSSVIMNQDEIMKCWRNPISEIEPVIVCIHGSYMNVIAIRNVLGCTDNLASSWSDGHGDNRGPSHHDHSSGIRVGLGSLTPAKQIDSISNLSLQKGVKIRNEKDGALVAYGFNGFFVNRSGKEIIDSIHEKKKMSLEELKILFKKSGISEDLGISFVERLSRLGILDVQ